MTESTGIYLVDTNSYLRVAKTFNWILGDHVDMQLRLVPEIAEECRRNARLSGNWPWLHEPPHPDSRDNWTLTFDAKETRQIKQSKIELRRPLDDCLEEFAAKRRARNDFRPVLSSPDRAVFCTAEALGFGIVTDEQALSLACAEFEVKHLTTLALLREFTTKKLVTRAQVDSMVRYWQVEKDAPKGWQAQYKGLFGEPIPFFE